MIKIRVSLPSVFQPQVSETPVDVGIGKVGIELDGTITVLESLRVVLNVIVSVTSIAVNYGRVGINLHGDIVVLNGRLVLLKFIKHNPSTNISTPVIRL